jgi:quinol monooxygenase YgiN
MTGATAITSDKIFAQITQRSTRKGNNMINKHVMVTVQLTAKDLETTLNILSRALPVTRTYKGCRFINTFVGSSNSKRIILIQGWDSRGEQEAYINWRQETGDLQKLVSTLSEPPLVEYWELNPA